MAGSDFLLTLDTAAAETPITLAEAKAHCRVDFSDDDTLITSLIAAATDYLDGPHGALGRCMVTQVWDVASHGGLYTGRARMPLPVIPANSIVAVTYYDRDNASQTATAADYQIYSTDGKSWVEPKKDKNWPQTYARPDGLTVQVSCGYGAASAVPDNIKQAMLLMIGHWYENREAVNVGNIVTEFPMAVESLLSISRSGWVGA